jgi:hypothetical protein
MILLLKSHTMKGVHYGAKFQSEQDAPLNSLLCNTQIILMYLKFTGGQRNEDMSHISSVHPRTEHHAMKGSGGKLHPFF